ncbi:S-layer homology domain-containing protein [Calothrix sp. CCY 0018]|uniref:S-layer homology domain-containing protein n=1 Tax=Calothrix sp. CCY 0018 TaxID=3103864 RepID=UPI0039C5E0DC
MGKFISSLSLIFLIPGFSVAAYAEDQNRLQQPYLVNMEREQKQNLPLPDFKDVGVEEEQPQDSAQSSKAIKRVVTAKLMTNFSDGNFYAEKLMSRAELAAIMVKTFGLDKRQVTDKDVQVADVPSSHWAYKDIQTVLKTEIMQGYRGNLFFPNQRVTRAEGLAIFAQAYGVFQFSDDTVAEILSQYSDKESIPNWARKAVATVITEGFIDSWQPQLSPLKPMTRGDMAYVLSQYLERQQPQPDTPIVPGGSVNPQPGL